MLIAVHMLKVFCCIAGMCCCFCLCIHALYTAVALHILIEQTRAITPGSTYWKVLLPAHSQLHRALAKKKHALLTAFTCFFFACVCVSLMFYL